MAWGFLVQSLHKSKEPYTCVSSFYTKEGNDNKQEERQRLITGLVQNEFMIMHHYEEGMATLTATPAGAPPTEKGTVKK